MTNKALIFAAALLLPAAATATDPGRTLDSNVAFYQGEKLNYIIYPPSGFKMVEGAARADGYSFAFIPADAEYDKAAYTVGVNIYKIRGMKFEELLRADTASIRQHYGRHAVIWPVDSVFVASGEEIPTFFINDTTNFIPNVMMSYYDGGTEVVIFELVISDRALRPKAEDLYIGCLSRFKVLRIGQLGQR